MTLNQNQFRMTPIQGLSAKNGGLVLPVQVAAGQATPLIPGQAVKISNTTGGIPQVVALSADTDATFGFVLFNQKDINYIAGARLEIAMAYTTVFMTAGAAIARGASVEVVSASSKVITYAGVNPLVGVALDAATLNGDLIPVLVLAPSLAISAIANISGLQTALNTLTTAAAAAQTSANAAAQIMQIVVTQAQLNAGQVLIPGVAGKKITVTNIQALYAGTFAAGTAMVIESTNASPVVVVTETLAGMAAGNQPIPYAGDTHQTLGAGWGVPLGTGDGLQAVHTGSAFTGGTSVTLAITYQQV